MLKKNTNVNKYLYYAGFFDASKTVRLEIIKDVNFFKLLSSSEKTQLTPETIFNKINNIFNKTTDLIERDIYYLQDNAERFKSIDQYLNNMNFYILANQNPIPMNALQNIIKSNKFRKILAENANPYVKYYQHVNSNYVKEQTETGVCIDIVNPNNINETSEKEQAEEGH